jgi:hypothetical protein
LIAKLPRPLWLTVFASLLLLLGMLGYTGSSGVGSVRVCPLLSPDERCAHAEIVGRSRPIRSDEWAVDAPIERSQQLANPSFPLVNLDQGLGQLARNSYGVPVLDWGAAFRPLLWPLFTRNRWGFGLRWFFRSFVVLVGLVSWFRTVTSRPDSSELRDRDRPHLTALAAVAVFYSSAVSWWMSTPMVEMIGFAGLGVAAGRRWMVASRPRTKTAWAAATLYLFTCTFFCFYPPGWAPLLWLIAASFVDCRWRDTRSTRRSLMGALPAIVAVAIAVGTAVAYFSPYLLAVSHTVYPGARRAISGGYPLSRLLTLAWPSVGIVAPLDGVELYLGTDGSNVCEFSAVEVIPFFVLLGAAAVRGPIRLAVTRAITGNPWLVATWLVLAGWEFLPLPAAFGTLTLLEWTPAQRGWFGFGIGTALLAVTMLVELPGTWPLPGRFAKREAIVAALTGLLSWLLLRTHLSGLADPSQALPYFGPMALGAVLTWLGVALSRRNVGAWLVAFGWVVPLVVANLSVNPLVSSRDLFVRGEGHTTVRAAVAARPGRLVDYGTHPGAVIFGEGFASLGGVQVAPDPDLYGFLAPESPGLTESVFNRYAHVVFQLPPNQSRLIQSDWMAVAISPCSSRLATLWVNHFLVPRAAQLPPDCAAEFDVEDAGGSRLWSRRAPVGPVGIARSAAPGSALEFDFRAASPVRLTRRRDALLVEAPPGLGAFATAVNLSLVDRVSCEGATASTLDAHVIITPNANSRVRCRIQFLGTAGALRRLAGLFSAENVAAKR